MELKDIASLLNDKIIQNTIGVDVTIAENLDNIVDYGTALSSATATQMKDFTQAFVAGILKNLFDTQTIEFKSLGIMKTTEEYKGIIQSVKNRALISAVSSPVGKLQNGQSYIDGTYHAPNFDNKIYDKRDSFRIPFSIPSYDQVKQSFTSIEGVNGFIALIRANVENSRRTQLHALEKRTVNGLIVNCKNGGREIPLVTMWNADNPNDQLTAANCQFNALFLRYAGEKMKRIKSGAREVNTKYNDGTVYTFTPADEINTILLEEFATSLDFNMLSDTRNLNKVDFGTFETVPYWQNQSDELIPTLGVTAEIKTTDGAEDDETIITVSNVIGVVFAKDACACSSTPMPIAIEEVGGGRFINYFDDEVTGQFVDSRNAAVIFTLN